MEGNGGDLSEEDLLWKEMELALASLYFLDDNEELDSYSNVREFSRDKSKKVCNHDYRLNEQIGIICRLCGFVSTEMKYVSPSFFSNPSSCHKEQKAEEESEDKENKDSALNQFNIPSASCSAPSTAEGEHNVWTLIPELGSKLRIHQQKAF